MCFIFLKIFSVILSDTRFSSVDCCINLLWFLVIFKSILIYSTRPPAFHVISYYSTYFANTFAYLSLNHVHEVSIFITQTTSTNFPY